LLKQKEARNDPLSERVVQQVGKSLHLIMDEIARWRKILDKPYLEYKLSR
jgi:hypothetical protein